MGKLKLDDGEQAGYDILCGVIPPDLVDDIVRLRRRKKANLTVRVANRLATEYRAFGDPEKAAEIHLMRGWTSFECSWVRNVVTTPIIAPRQTPFQQRHQSAIDAFDHALGRSYEQSPGYDIELEPTDFRTH